MVRENEEEFAWPMKNFRFMGIPHKISYSLPFARQPTRSPVSVSMSTARTSFYVAIVSYATYSVLFAVFVTLAGFQKLEQFDISFSGDDAHDDILVLSVIAVCTLINALLNLVNVFWVNKIFLIICTVITSIASLCWLCLTAEACYLTTTLVATTDL